MSADCKLCSFKLANVHGGADNSYYCTNQDSPQFGKEAVCGCDGYWKFDPRPQMSVKDALEMVVMLPRGAYPSYFFLFGKEDDLQRPCLFLSFESNRQMLEYREALMRLFDELMRLKREAGDFDEGKPEGKENAE